MTLRKQLLTITLDILPPSRLWRIVSDKATPLTDGTETFVLIQHTKTGVVCGYNANGIIPINESYQTICQFIDVPAAIKLARIAHGMTQTDLEIKLKLPHTMQLVRKWESRLLPVTRKYRHQISEILNINLGN